MGLRTAPFWLVFLMAGCLPLISQAQQATPQSMVAVPTGEFWMGSTPEEREYG